MLRYLDGDRADEDGLPASWRSLMSSMAALYFASFVL
jgi:hypothetical protein